MSEIELGYKWKYSGDNWAKSHKEVSQLKEISIRKKGLL